MCFSVERVVTNLSGAKGVLNGDAVALRGMMYLYDDQLIPGLVYSA